MMKGTEFTLKALAKVATKIYGLHAWGDGEFLSFEESDVTRNTVHVHFYKDNLALEDDKVEITGHAIWSKSKEASLRQPFTLVATQKTRWTAKLVLGEAETTAEGKSKDKSVTAKFQPPPNAELKKKLYEEVVDTLADMLAEVLNEDHG